MTNIRIKQLIWDEWNTNHIKKHNLVQEEVEIAITHISVHRIGYKGRFILIGSSGKRILAMIMVKEKKNKYYVITARDADRRERKLLYEKEQQGENS